MDKHTNRVAFTPDYIVLPGASLRDAMEQLSMTQAALALRLDSSVQTLNRIFKGSQSITPDMAVKLEMVMGTPARFWINLQAQYDELKAKREEGERLAEEERQRREWVRKFPLREMVKRGYIPNTKDATETYRELLAYFGMSNGEAWPKFWDGTVAARRSAKHETDLLSAAVWIRQGERLANQMMCAEYNEERFKAALKEIRSLTTKHASAFIPAMTELCAYSGVALVFVRDLPKVPWNGATKWLKGKGLIILSLRGRSEDKFWFSFFHEAAHVLHDCKNQLHYADESDDPVELGADKRAAEYLIPATFNQRIRDAHSANAMQNIARELGVAPGIVAGRRGHLTGNWAWFRKMIRSLAWDGDTVVMK